MGISPAGLELLLDEVACRPLAGRGLVLGRQHVTFDAAHLARRAEAHRVSLAGVPLELSQAPSLASKGYISDTYLFRQLGCDSLDALDFDGSEGATLLHDLNRTDLPESLRGQFDVICDIGTVEHVFHTPNALLCIHDLLADKGRIIHFSPMQNWVGHGFMQFCPAYFSEYYDWNLYRVDHVLMNRLDVWEFVQGIGTNHPYDADFFLANHFGVFDAAVWSVWVSAAKTRSSTRGRIPVQARYLQSRMADPAAALDRLQSLGFAETVIYGAAEVGQSVLREARSRGIRIPFFVDDSAEKQGTVIDGVPVVSIVEAIERGPHVYIVGSVLRQRNVVKAIHGAYGGARADCRIIPVVA
jgi:SAM-dependent methyltransferase